MLKNQNREREVIGLLPAAGQARRIAPLPLSKELYPIGFRYCDENQNLRPKVVCHYLLEKMHLAGITKAYIILREGKWDIPQYLGDGAMIDIKLGYLMMNLPFGVPYTLDQAYLFVKEAIVALGFPDIIFWPDDVFTKLLARLAASEADVVLGLFPTERSDKAGMVDFDQEGLVRLIKEKPKQTDLQYMWGAAVWTPVFTSFLHEYLITIEASRQQNQASNYPNKEQELPIGDVIQAAINSGLQVQAEVFAGGEYLDIGTSEDLVRAVRRFAHSKF